MSFYPRLFEAGLYNKGAGNVFLLKELTSKFPTKYTFKTGARIENRGRVSWDELINDIKSVVAENNLDVDPASIQVKSLKKAEGGISDKYPTLFFNIDGKDFKVKFSGAGSGEQMTQTPTVFKEGLVCYFFTTKKSYAAFSKRKPAEKEAGYVSLLDTMIKDISKSGIKGLNEKDKTKILDILKKEIVAYNGDILGAIFNAMSVGNKLRSNKFVGGRFIPWEVYRDDFFNNMKSEAAVGIGFPSKASDKWNPMDILLVKPGMKKEIEKRWAEAAKEENKDLKLGKYNSIFLDELDSENAESIALAISLKEEKAQAGKGKSYLDSIETLKEKYNITPKEKSWDTQKLMSEIARLRKTVNTTLKKNNVENLFLYKKESGEFAKPESALSKYGSMKMLTYLLDKVDEKNNIFIDLAAYSLSLGKNPTFFKFIANKDGDADEVNVHKFEAKGGISLYDITKYKAFDNYDGKIWITDNNNNAGVQITYYIVLASVVYIANLVIRTGGSTQVFIEIQKFKELKDLTENKNEDMFYPRLFEKFKEQSDPVKDLGIGLSEEENLLYTSVKLFGNQRIFWKLSEEEKRNMRGRVPTYDLNRTLPMSINDWNKLKKEMGWQRVPKRYIRKVNDPNTPWAGDMLKELNYAQIFSDVYGDDWYYDDVSLVQGDRTIVNLFPYPGITFKELVKKVQTSKELKIRKKK